MKWVSYAWAVITGLLRLGFVVLVLQAFQGRFEQAVISLLVIIYTTLEGWAIHNAFIIVEQAKLAQTRFLAIMKALGSTEFDAEETKEALKEEQQRIDRNIVKGYIRAVVNLLIFLLALWILFNSLA